MRDESLLQSALGGPLNHVAYASSDIIELAAMYTAGIVKIILSWKRYMMFLHSRSGFERDDE